MEEGRGGEGGRAGLIKRARERGENDSRVEREKEANEARVGALLPRDMPPATGMRSARLDAPDAEANSVPRTRPPRRLFTGARPARLLLLVPAFADSSGLPPTPALPVSPHPPRS